jgi:hypothetical protein
MTRSLVPLVGGAGVCILSLLSGCDALPFTIKPPKPPFRMSPLKHEVTIQPAPGMGPAPFAVERAHASSTEVSLVLSNRSAGPIRILWRDGLFISTDSITYALGLKAGPQVAAVPEPTTIASKGTVQVTVVAVTRDGKPATGDPASVEPPYRVGLKLVVEAPERSWKGTVWIFVS